MAEKPDSTTMIGKIRENAASLRQTLLGAFGVMVVAFTIASALNYLFNIIMNRMLGTEAYGDFYSLTAIFLIVTLGATSVQAAITKYTAEFEATGDQNKTRILLRSYTRGLALVGVGVLILSAALALPVAHVLKLESPLFVIILGSSIAVTLYITLPYGLLQGQQKFLGLGAAAISTAMLRILAGVVMVLIGFGVYGALGAGTVGAVVVAVAASYYYRDMYRAPVEKVEDFHAYDTLKFMGPVVLASVLIILLTQIDAIMVKALFSRSMAGRYSYAALAGKAVLFFPEGIAVVMFPRVNQLRVQGKPTRRVLVLSLVSATVMVGAVAAFYVIFPKFTMYVFAAKKGQHMADAVALVGLFGIVMALFALVKLLALYHLALEKYRFIWLFVVAGIVEVGGILLFHGSLREVVRVLFAVSASLFVVNLILAFRERPQKSVE